MLSDQGTALVMSTLAGACTCIGGLLAFFVQLRNTVPLAVSMAFSAGVMVYASLTEIFGEATEHFENWGSSEGMALLFATLSFFAGALLAVGMEKVANLIGTAAYDSEKVQTSVNPAAKGATGPRLETCCQNDSDSISVQVYRAAPPFAKGSSKNGESASVATATHEKPETDLRVNKDEQAIKDKRILYRSGLATALALGLHNFPEGLATFTSAMDSPSLGAAIAVAIGLHNIPEGISVAAPVLYATGSRWRAFFWASVSGFVEPVAALIAWAVLDSVMNDAVFGVMFGIVGGIMTFISMHELYPMALKYDPKNKYSTFCLFAGCAFMAASLVAFDLA